jgi:hypothetical protein
MERREALAVVTRTFQVGQGTFWDCRQIDFMALRAPKGKLDANDKLFKFMIDSVRPVPKWQAYANSTIGKFYQVESQKEAAEDQALADFQRKVAQTIMATVANAQRGANQSAFGKVKSFAVCKPFAIRRLAKPWSSAISTTTPG